MPAMQNAFRSGPAVVQRITRPQSDHERCRSFAQIFEPLWNRVVADFVPGRFGAFAIAGGSTRGAKPGGGPAGIRTETLPILSRLPLQVGLRGLVVGVPGFEPGRSNGALCSTGRRGQAKHPRTFEVGSEDLRAVGRVLG